MIAGLTVNRQTVARGDVWSVRAAVVKPLTLVHPLWDIISAEYPLHRHTTFILTVVLVGSVNINIKRITTPGSEQVEVNIIQIFSSWNRQHFGVSGLTFFSTDFPEIFHRSPPLQYSEVPLGAPPPPPFANQPRWGLELTIWDTAYERDFK